MTVGRIVTAILVTGLISVVPVHGYAFNLSQMLGGGEEQHLTTFKLIHTGDLKTMMGGARNKVHIYDANIDATREKFGIIPGAILLTSYENYSLSDLPHSKDATLVFYCADSH